MEVIVIGGGPAGLTAAYELSRLGALAAVLEADPRYVGGISRTAQYKGYRFDIGGHRFFSKSEEIEALWKEILPDDFIERPRSSRICYRGKFYSYPLRALEALRNLGLLDSFLCGLSYLKARISPIAQPVNFEEYVVNLFGRRLYSIFFKTYTEKVWGMSCTSISADWAAQRIKGLSLAKAVLDGLGLRNRKEVVKSLITTFRYPRLGPGMMWDACAARIKHMGGAVKMGATVESAVFDASSRKWTIGFRLPDGNESTLIGDAVVSTLPMRTLCQILHPPMSDKAMAAANALRYRDFLVVAIILKGAPEWNDQWIYIHDPGVKVGRVQNFRAWSPDLLPDPDTTCLGLEYFCAEGDGIWTSTDAELQELAIRELETLGLASREHVLDGTVVRQPKAYPVYDATYRENVEIIRDEIKARYPGLHLVGRNGMHKYNNQDHSMMTALLAARNIVAGKELEDPWLVNEDASYHEQGTSGLRSVPMPIPPAN